LHWRRAEVQLSKSERHICVSCDLEQSNLCQHASLACSGFKALQKRAGECSPQITIAWSPYSTWPCTVLCLIALNSTRVSSSVIQRAALSARESSTYQETKEAATGHGAKVQDSAKRAVRVSHPEYTRFFVARQGGDDQGQTFSAICMAGYSVLLHNQGRSKVLRQGADKAAASLHLEVKDGTGPSLGGKKGLARGTSTSSDLPAMLQTTKSKCPASATLVTNFARYLHFRTPCNHNMLTTSPFVQFLRMQGEAFVILYCDCVLLTETRTAMHTGTKSGIGSAGCCIICYGHGHCGPGHSWGLTVPGLS
jgi:hypothetical protein